MYHSCSLSSLSACAFNALLRTNKSRYPLTINIVEFRDGVQLILLKSCFDECLECQVTVLSKLDFLKHVCKSIDFQKKSVHHLNSNLQPLERKSAVLPIKLHICCGFQWNVARVFSTSSAAECNLITTLTHGDKFEVGGWSVHGVRQLICWCWQSQASYRRDGWSDRWMAIQLYIYIDFQNFHMWYLSHL